MGLFTANRGSKNSFYIRMGINGIWIAIGLFYVGGSFYLQDHYNMMKYVARGGAYHDSTGEMWVGVIIIAIAAYCLYRNYKKSQVSITLTPTGIIGKDSTGRTFDIPLSEITNVRIVNNVLVIDSQYGQLQFKKIKNTAKMANMILDEIEKSGRSPLPIQ